MFEAIVRLGMSWISIRHECTVVFSNLVLVCLQPLKCFQQVVSLLQRLHGQDIMLFVTKQVAGYATCLYRITHHQSRYLSGVGCNGSVCA